MKRIRQLILALAACGLCFGLIACGGSSSGKLPEYGFDTDVATKVVVSNGLGQDLVSLGYGKLDEGWSVEFDLTETPLAADGECILFLESEGKPVDFLATGADGTVYEVVDVPAETGMTVKLVSADGMFYAEYTAEDGTTGDSKAAAAARQEQLDKEAADMAAADAVDDLAILLPTGDDLTLEDEAAIVAAREAYNALTDEQKMFFSAEEADFLITEAENALQALKDGEGEAADEEGEPEEESYDEGYEESYDEGSDEGEDYDDYEAPEQSEDDCLDEPVIRN